jgi:hypothetical protein
MTDLYPATSLLLGQFVALDEMATLIKAEQGSYTAPEDAPKVARIKAYLIDHMSQVINDALDLEL